MFKLKDIFKNFLSDNQKTVKYCIVFPFFIQKLEFVILHLPPPANPPHSLFIELGFANVQTKKWLYMVYTDVKVRHCMVYKSAQCTATSLLNIIQRKRGKRAYRNFARIFLMVNSGKQLRAEAWNQTRVLLKKN